MFLTQSPDSFEISEFEASTAGSAEITNLGSPLNKTSEEGDL